MLKANRLDMIMDLLYEKRYLSINDLMKYTQISKSTLRRDLFELESVGNLIRIRGGVRLPDAAARLEQSAYEAPFSVRSVANAEEKEKIATAALQLIQPGDTVILDSGTTTLPLGQKISRQFHNLMVATNDLHCALELASNDDLELVVIGGQLRKKHYSTYGYIADRSISEMHADMAFITGDAVDISHGLMAFSMQEVTSKRAMIQAAKESTALCDHTKFSSIAFVTVCGLSEIDRIITGEQVDPQIVDKLRKLGIEVLLV